MMLFDTHPSLKREKRHELAHLRRPSCGWQFITIFLWCNPPVVIIAVAQEIGIFACNS